MSTFPIRPAFVSVIAAVGLSALAATFTWAGRGAPSATSVFAATPAVPGQAGASAPPAGDSPLTLSPCRVEHPTRIVGLGAECGVLEVPENPAAPEGRRIRLNVVRVAAISRRKADDPLFVLAGGPGMAASTFYTGAAPAFARIAVDRDVVLVDQRGTGQSNPLTCELDEAVVAHASEAVLAAETERCLSALSTRADVRFYTTSVAVQDLERVRAALGYERINLYGVSYGTRVAQHYVRRHPGRVRSVILDGVVPAELILGPAIALDAEAALAGILERCTRDMACRRRFGDPAATYRALRESLRERPVEVSLPDPASGEPWRLRFTDQHLATVLRLASYTAEQAALLPLTLDTAHNRGDFAPLVAQFLLASRSYENVLAYGMHNSVVCTEDVPFFDHAGVDRERLENTYLGTTQLDGLRNVCRIWPRGLIDPDFHAPLRADVPALLLSGSNDPVTPPAYAEQAKRGFAEHLHVVLQGLGHGQLGAPCVDRIMAQFIRQGSVKGIDVACTKDVAPMPFFLSPAGPSP